MFFNRSYHHTFELLYPFLGYSALLLFFHPTTSASISLHQVCIVIIGAVFSCFVLLSVKAGTKNDARSCILQSLSSSISCIQILVNSPYHLFDRLKTYILVFGNFLVHSTALSSRFPPRNSRAPILVSASCRFLLLKNSSSF